MKLPPNPKPPPCKFRCTSPKPAPQDDEVRRLNEANVAYLGLMGDPDEVDEFFRLPQVAGRDPSSFLVLRVTGKPHSGTAWVH